MKRWSADFGSAPEASSCLTRSVRPWRAAATNGGAGVLSASRSKTRRRVGARLPCSSTASTTTASIDASLTSRSTTNKSPSFRAGTRLTRTVNDEASEARTPTRIAPPSTGIGSSAGVTHASRGASVSACVPGTGSRGGGSGVGVRGSGRGVCGCAAPVPLRSVPAGTRAVCAPSSGSLPLNTPRKNRRPPATSRVATPPSASSRLRLPDSVSAALDAGGLPRVRDVAPACAAAAGSPLAVRTAAVAEVRAVSGSARPSSAARKPRQNSLHEAWRSRGARAIARCTTSHTPWGRSARSSASGRGSRSLLRDDDLERRRPRERHLTGERVIDGGTKGVQVGAPGHPLVTAGLLGRHVRAETRSGSRCSSCRAACLRSPSRCRSRTGTRGRDRRTGCSLA